MDNIYKVRNIIAKEQIFFRRSGNKEIRYSVVGLSSKKVRLNTSSGGTVSINIATFLKCVENGKFYSKSGNYALECQCGAKHTSNPEYHSDYCQLFK